ILLPESIAISRTIAYKTTHPQVHSREFPPNGAVEVRRQPPSLLLLPGPSGEGIAALERVRGTGLSSRPGFLPSRYARASAGGGLKPVAAVFPAPPAFPSAEPFRADGVG